MNNSTLKYKEFENEKKPKALNSFTPYKSLKVFSGSPKLKVRDNDMPF